MISSLLKTNPDNDVRWTLAEEKKAQPTLGLKEGRERERFLHKKEKKG